MARLLLPSRRDIERLVELLPTLLVVVVVVILQSGPSREDGGTLKEALDDAPPRTRQCREIITDTCSLLGPP